MRARWHGSWSGSRASKRSPVWTAASSAPVPALVSQEPREPLERRFSEPLPLEHEPLLEEGFLDGEPLEEIALIEGHGLGECGRGAVGQAVLETADIHIDGRGVEGNRAPVEIEPGGGLVGQDSADDEESLTQALPRQRLGPIPPEESGQLIPGMRPAERHGKVREHGLSLAGRQRERRSRIQPGAEASEESEADERHGPLRGYAGEKFYHPPAAAGQGCLDVL